MATKTKRAEVAPLDGKAARGGGRGASGIKHATRAEALDIIFRAAEEEGEGFRTAALGIPRRGKTYHLKEVISQALERGIVNWAFIHDCKRSDVQYDGNVRADVPALAAAPIGPEEEPIVIFHGDPANGIKANVEEVAAFGMAHGRGTPQVPGDPCVVLVDELTHALKSRQTWDLPPGSKSTFAEIIREGSSQKVSSAFSTQFPQWIPTEGLDFCETIAIFQLTGRSLSYVIEMLRLPPEIEDVIRNLQKGEFVLVSIFEEWDRTIYGPK